MYQLQFLLHLEVFVFRSPTLSLGLGLEANTAFMCHAKSKCDLLFCAFDVVSAQL